jgi:hypothetical protein
VSIKDRWVGSREQVLNISITCWCYVPSKPSSGLSIEDCLFPLSHWLLWERSLVRTHGSDGHRPVDCVGSPSSQASGSVQICWRLHERLLCVDHMRYVWLMAIRRLSVWRVGRVFLYRVYIDSNCHNSRIWVSLICDSHHVANLINLMSLIVLILCCLIHLIVCNSYMIRIWCTFLSKWFEELKFESKDSLLAQVWHSIELSPWSLAY